MNICVVQYSKASISETFIRAHIDLLPANVTTVQGLSPSVGNTPILAQNLYAKKWRAFKRKVTTADESERSSAYKHILRESGADVVLAEYGTTGVAVGTACERLGVPLVVHFHGYDASRHDILSRYSEKYERMFQQAAAIIAVSRTMRSNLIALGAPADKVFVNPCGVDCEKFTPANPAEAHPVFLTVGRFVEKKAPHLSLLAFARVVREHPDARLHMIGDGPLLNVCRDLAAALGMDSAVRFLGPQSHDVVVQEMRKARAFVQHSVIAANGDSEGTPVAVLEAGASGLPVVSTIHAGIPDVVLHERTGLLVNERDVDGMADHMTCLIRNPMLAAALGRAARTRVAGNSRLDQHIDRLWSIIRSCTEGRARPPVDYIMAGSNGQHVAHAIREAGALI